MISLFSNVTFPLVVLPIAEAVIYVFGNVKRSVRAERLP